MLEKIKNISIGVAIGITIVISGVSAGQRGSIGDLFDKITGIENGISVSGQWRLDGQNIKDSTVGSAEIINGTITQDDIQINTIGLNYLSDAKKVGSSLFIGDNAGNADDGLHNGSYDPKNLGIGNGSLENVTNQGVSNIALGSYALRDVSSADNNVALGEGTLLSNVIGGGNVAVGNYSLLNNYQNGNTAIGYEAMFASNDSGYNTAVGNRAMKDADMYLAGGENQAFGMSSLYVLNGGWSNNALGARSLASLSVGSNNTAIGNQSLHNLVTGDNNVALGYQAGYNETGNSKLYIANGSNYSSTWIYGDENYNIAIGGILDPNEKLDVNGKIRMRTETQTGDNNDIVATKGYVDSADTDWIQSGGNVYNLTGNVGIGRVNTGQKFAVFSPAVGNLGGYFKLFNNHNDPSSGPYNELAYNGGADSIFSFKNLGDVSGGTLFNAGGELNEYGNGIMILQNNGMVSIGGLGINNATQKLDVKGKIRMRIPTSSGDGNDIVATKGYVDDQSAPAGMCVMMTSCASGWTDSGHMGIIQPTGTCSIGTTGAAFNSSRDWCHPKLCCK